MKKKKTNVVRRRAETLVVPSTQRVYDPFRDQVGYLTGVDGMIDSCFRLRGARSLREPMRRHMMQEGKED